MKIQEVSIPIELTKDLGLKPIQMKRLGDVVLLAGKNGSGKSRLLRLVRQMIDAYPDNAANKELNRKIKIYEDAINGTNYNIEQHRRHLNDPNVEESEKGRLIGAIQIEEGNLSSHHQNIAVLKPTLGYRNNLKIIPDKLQTSIIDFVPKILRLEDSYNISPSQLDEYSNLIYSQGVNQIHKGAIPAIEKIQKIYVNSRNASEDIEITDAEKGQN